MVGVDSGKLPVAGKDCVEGLRLAAKWSEFGDRLPGASDCEPFALDYSVDNVAAMIAVWGPNITSWLVTLRFGIR